MGGEIRRTSRYGRDCAYLSEPRDPFDIKSFGFVVKTAHLRESVEFYSETLDLPVWFRGEDRVCLRMGDAYLMLEEGTEPNNAFTPPVLQFSVADVTIAAGQLSMRGVRVELKSGDKGIQATFQDPDGNICELIQADEGFGT